MKMAMKAFKAILKLSLILSPSVKFVNFNLDTEKFILFTWSNKINYEIGTKNCLVMGNPNSTKLQLTWFHLEVLTNDIKFPFFGNYPFFLAIYYLQKSIKGTSKNLVILLQLLLIKVCIYSYVVHLHIQLNEN